MQYLLDTHLLIWLIYDSSKLSKKAKDIILDEDNEIFYSTASLWEIEIKHKKNPKKLPFTAKEVADACLDSNIENLPIFNKYIYQLDNINKKKGSPDHNDPFDLVLLAQAKRAYKTLLTHDDKFKYYNEDCIIIVWQ